MYQIQQTLCFPGFGVYFYYGIKHSSLEEEDDSQNIELSVQTDVGHQPPSVHIETKQPPPPDSSDYSQPTPQQTTAASSLNVQARNPLFVSTSQFPTWDD